MSKSTHPPASPQGFEEWYRRLIAESFRDEEAACKRVVEVFRRQQAERRAKNFEIFGKDRGGRPRALSAELMREMQARAIELWRECGSPKKAQGRVARQLRIEWRERGIEVGLSTIIRHVVKPLRF